MIGIIIKMKLENTIKLCSLFKLEHLKQLQASGEPITNQMLVTTYEKFVRHYFKIMGKAYPTTLSDYVNESVTLLYLNETQRIQYLLKIDEASQFSQQNDHICDEEYLCVAQYNGKEGLCIYAHQIDNQEVMNHSHFVAGEAVAFSGHMSFEDGNLVGFDNNSGHYKPTLEPSKHFIEALVKKLDLETIRFTNYACLAAQDNQPDKFIEVYEVMYDGEEIEWGEPERLFITKPDTNTQSSVINSSIKGYDGQSAALGIDSIRYVLGPQVQKQSPAQNLPLFSLFGSNDTVIDITDQTKRQLSPRS